MLFAAIVGDFYVVRDSWIQLGYVKYGNLAEVFLSKTECRLFVYHKCLCALDYGEG